jgi:hypothetical protein
LSDSSVYIVSPPTLYMPGGGIGFCLISNDKAWQDTVIGLLEKGIQNQLTFYATESSTKDPKAWVWYWHVVDNCSMIFVDMASCSEHEIRMAMAMSKLDQPVVFHVKPGNDEFVALLNAVDIPWFEDFEQLLALMEVVLGG